MIATDTPSIAQKVTPVVRVVTQVCGWRMYATRQREQRPPAAPYNGIFNQGKARNTVAREEALIMALQADKTKDQRDAASIAAAARELFEKWEAEEEAGYRGEIPWEEFEREINIGRPPHSRPFRED